MKGVPALIRQDSYSAVLVSSGQWTELLAQFPEATVFHTLPWLNAIAATHNLGIVLVGALYAARMVGLWPCLVMRKGPVRVIGSPLPGWSTAYLGPLVAADVDPQEVVQCMLKHRQLSGYAYFACKVVDQHREINLEPLGFTPVLKYETFRLNLAPSEDELWSNVRHECRRHIRKATKQGVEVRKEQTEAFLDDYWDMVNESFSRSGLKPSHNRELLTEIWNRLHPTGQLHAFSAFHAGQRIASIIIVGDERVMYNWGSASRGEFRRLSAPSLLQWEAIRLAKQLSIPMYDMISTSGGAGKFKEGFGPQAVEVSTHWERCPSKLLMSMKRGYERYLRWKQRTPVLVGAESD